MKELINSRELEYEGNTHINLKNKHARLLESVNQNRKKTIHAFVEHYAGGKRARIGSYT